MNKPISADQRFRDVRSLHQVTEREGLPPTVREFQDECLFSSTSVARYRLLNLAKHGLAENRKDGSARGWRLTDKGKKALA